MLNASNYLATETLPNGLRLLIRATEPHDDLAGAIQRKTSTQSFFYRFLRPKHYLADEEIASLRNCDFVSQVALIGLVRHNLRMAIVAGARYWITQPDEAEITFMVADDYQKQGIGTAILNHLCSIARGVDPMDPNLDPTIRSHGPNLDPSGPLAPNTSCKNADTTASAEKPNQINESESPIVAKKASDEESKKILRKNLEREAAAGDTTAQAALQRAGLLAMTSEAIQHADKKKG